MTFVSLVPPIYTNIRSYGAIGDGTTDDTSAILAALASIPTATGGVLYTPPNMTCVVSASIDTSAFPGNLYILGGGFSSVWKLANGANCYLIKNTSSSMTGMRVSNMKLDCNSAGQTAASGGISAYKWRRCSIDNVWIHNPWQAGVYFTGDSNDFGFYNRITNNWIEGGSTVTSGTNAYGNAIRFENTDENVVYGNQFENNGNFSDPTYNFHIYDKGGLSTYTGNNFVNGAGGIKIDGLQCRIVGNSFDSNGFTAVQANSGATGTMISTNNIPNVGFRATGGTANSINGIYLSATRCIVRGNHFTSDNSATPKTNSFVFVDTGATYSEIDGNTLNIKSGSGTVFPFILPGGLPPTGTSVRFNQGFNFVSSAPVFQTEAHGTAQIIGGTTSIVVTHGLAITPALEQISVTLQSTLGSATVYWISTPTSTTFQINTNINPGMTVTFGWKADVGY